MLGLKVMWCSWFHGGGTIERDHKGRINWRCVTCGRWSDSPVSTDHEDKVIDDAIREYRSSQ